MPLGFNLNSLTEDMARRMRKIKLIAEYKKKKYDHINKLLDIIAKDNGLKSHKDFKRIENN